MFDVLYFIVEVLKKVLLKEVCLLNGIYLLIGVKGVCIINNVNELVYYEYGVNLVFCSMLKVLNVIEVG